MLRRATGSTMKRRGEKKRSRTFRQPDNTFAGEGNRKMDGTIGSYHFTAGRLAVRI